MSSQLFFLADYGLEIPLVESVRVATMYVDNQLFLIQKTIIFFYYLEYAQYLTKNRNM